MLVIQRFMRRVRILTVDWLRSWSNLGDSDRREGNPSAPVSFRESSLMILESIPIPLGAVLADIGPAARLLTGDESQLSRQVRGTVVLLKPEDLPDDPDIVVVCPRLANAADAKEFFEHLRGPERVIFIAGTASAAMDEVQALAGRHLVVAIDENLNVADVVMSISGSMQVPEESVSRRLASLQRALSQAMTDPEPIPALLNRLAHVCNATAALVDKSGHSVHTTGPIPMSLLFDEIARTEADSQRLDVDGWRGIAARISAPVEAESHFGWLVVTARRPNFPDAYSTSAAHVAATLVEASQRMAVAARQQERAIRTAVLEEALALRREPHNPELAGRISAFGLSFADELRTIVFRPIRSSVASRSLPGTDDLSEMLGKALESQSIAYLMTTRDKTVTITAQCSVQTFRRIVIAEGSKLPGAHIGIGRSVHALGDILDSYQDAQLAVRTLRRAARGPKIMAYEDFNYATRLFADVGFDKMITWAQEFLKPLEGRELLVEGLQTYFEHSQNINAAADYLGIHHNSLRYRLAKAEEILGINLREPGAVSSVFLALTALELGRLQQPRPKSSGEDARSGRPSDVEAVEALPYARPTVERAGVVRAPAR
ncbi:CdaR family transcriptional regulator [Arthrobacter sp. ISL-30]|uniref:PucR family transcriptional regulator n=1 Tax=Arthrobacter sp. ISL-30 TaxID=2819109 RepID=UPI001BE752C2|nr:helix-turn-helix domain-containing protein [Arthrobacter sp. ISL-30]MBT2514707.1 helix-turn-helix domain-containing protein [Arthrobacter sp. ISL-30]